MSACHSWEQHSGLPWENASTQGNGVTPPGTSFLYPHLIEVHRLQVRPGTGGIGLGPESGTDIGETVLYTGIAAQIGVRAAGRSKGPLPADVVYRPSWTITIPAYALTENDVRDSDIVVDDSGYRYAVGAAAWTPLGYELVCQRLEI